MKQILFIIIGVVNLLLITSCSNNEQPLENIENIGVVESPFESDTLIVKLKSLNDSLISQSHHESRGLFSFLRILDELCIIAADVKGAVDGAKWGGSVLGVPGAVLGSVVVGATYSAMAGLCMDSRSCVENKIKQKQIELAYVNATLNDELIQNERTENSSMTINIPVEYKSSLDAGVYHNITLKIIDEELPLEYALEDGLTSEELSMLHSDEFTSKYNYSINNPEVFSIDYMCANPNKEDKIIQLFLQAYQEYPSELGDLEYLINRYIDLIESDSQITDLQKSAVYSALSTAAYSTNYWYNKIKQ
ncbi:MAG: hypothetical protein HDS17_05350 [Bacteroides sp.]|nr:hypothetical protein [Bacteroides sp.]MDE5826871.1 hypothetical protein [Duncaniella sp.]